MGRGVRALSRRMPDQISDASETMDCRALFLLARELPQTHHRLRISGQYRRDDGATRLLGNQFFTNLYKQSVLASKCNLKQNFIVTFWINHVFSHQIFLFDTRIFLFIHFSNTYNMAEYIFAA